MAKRHITPLGRHKPVRSSWGAFDMQPQRDASDPYCFVTGQFPAMQAQWCKAQADKAMLDAVSIMQKYLSEGA